MKCPTLLPAPWPYKIVLFLLFVPFYAFFYIFPNFNPSYLPSLLPLLPGEELIPFMPWTFLLYTSDYFLMFFAIWSMDTPERVHRFMRRMCLCVMIGGFVFFVFPTIYNRPIYPPVDSAFLTWLMATVRELDAPTNCFPSMHVAFTAMATWSVRHKGNRVFAIFVFWSLLVFLSVLTTKQHYLIDILGGLAVVPIACWLEARISRSAWLRPWLEKWDRTPAWNWTLPPRSC